MIINQIFLNNYGDKKFKKIDTLNVTKIKWQKNDKKKDWINE